MPATDSEELSELSPFPSYLRRSRTPPIVSVRSLSTFSDVSDMPAFDNECQQPDGDPTSIPDLISDKIITVLAGPKLRRWSLHEGLLSSQCHNLSSFAVREGVVSFPAVDPRAFELFVGWIYAQPLKALNNNSTRLFSIPADEASASVAVREIMDLLYDYAKRNPKFPSADDMAYIYDQSLTNDKIRDLMVLCACYHLVGNIGYASNSSVLVGAKREEWAKVMERDSKIGRDIVLKMANWGATFNADARRHRMPPRCEFHVHEKTPKCSMKVVKLARQRPRREISLDLDQHT